MVETAGKLLGNQYIYGEDEEVLQTLIFLHCIIHQEVLCNTVLRLERAVDAVSIIVNFIRVRAFNHRQFIAMRLNRVT